MAPTTSEFDRLLTIHEVSEWTGLAVGIPPSQPEENSGRAVIETMHPLSLFRSDGLDRETHT